jgi:SWI/SNF-related matrix-associated actin-dependent regulator 1 of chromatin subfamily A
MHWDLLILDEAHYVRIPSTKRAKKVVALMKKVKNSLWLSGTPMMNTVMDLYIPLKLCLESREDVPPEHKLYLKNYNTFGAYFSHCRQTTFGKEYTGIRNPQILKEMINNNNFYYRLTKKEAELDLPDKTIQKIDLDFDVKTENTQEVETFLRSLENEKIPGLPPTHLTTMLRQLGEAKSTHSSAMEFIDNILEQGQPLVVFAYHKSVISNLYKYFKKYNPVVFDGSTSAEDKQKAVDDFQKGESQIFIGQIISAGTGITLTRASTCVFIEVTWLPSHITQAIDRLLRIGQKNAVIAYFLCTKNKVDERIIRAMVNKQKNIEKLL